MCCINQCQFKPEEEILMNDILEDMFDESEITDEIRQRYSNKYFPDDYRIPQLR